MQLKKYIRNSIVYGGLKSNIKKCIKVSYINGLNTILNVLAYYGFILIKK